jgi:hypothetical protein
VTTPRRYFDRQEDELARGSRLLPHHSHKVRGGSNTSVMAHGSMTRCRMMARTRTFFQSSARRLTHRRRALLLLLVLLLCLPLWKQPLALPSPPNRIVAWTLSDSDK